MCALRIFTTRYIYEGILVQYTVIRRGEFTMSSANTSTSATVTSPRAAGGFDRALGALQSIGRSLMLPIAVLPAAALLLRLGQPDLLNISWIAAAGNAIFANLSMIFAIGIAIGLTGGEGAAGLAALVGFLVFNGVFNTLIPQVGGQPDPNITMGVLSGILIGLVSAGLYRRFHDIRLPDYLAVFGGRRFVPIITALVSVALGAIFALIWRTVQTLITALRTDVVALGTLLPGL